MENYNPLLTENKWQSIFEREKLFVTKNKKKKILLS
jgi:leucyl-tRNA synthetase